MAAIKRGIHVYTEKPLTHTIFESRQLRLAAAKHKVATQMGNQGHAAEGARLTVEWIQAGVIGEVREVHTWSDRAGQLWPQGIPRPTETPAVPATLDWDLWLGPAPERPYHPAYAPFAWRGWWDFGTGAMGDMGCHIVDHPVGALNLGSPSSVEAVTTLMACKGQGQAMSNFSYSGPLTETVLLGVLAQRAPGTRLLWDSENLKITNMPELNQTS